MEAHENEDREVDSLSDFVECLKKSAVALQSTSETPVFGANGLLESLHELALSNVRSLENDDPNDTAAYRKSVFWTMECQSWDLIERLYPFRQSVELEQPFAHPFSSANVLEKVYYSTNKEALENHLVLQWLQDIAPSIEEPDFLSKEGWLNTREELTSIAMSGRSRAIDLHISELDPDAPQRQGKPIHPEDERAESAFNRYVFELIRRGDLDTALDVARRTGNYWIAAILQGTVEYQNPMIDYGTPGPVIGIKDKFTWRKTCYVAAQNSRIDSYRRAFLGAICGDLQSTLDVSKSLCDRLWAFYNCMTQNEIAEMLASFRDTPKAFTPILPAGLSLNKLVIFEKLMNAKIEDENSDDPWNSVSHPLRIIQSKVIVGSLNDEIETYASSLSESFHLNPGSYDDYSSAHFLRFTTHLLLALRRASFDITPNAMNIILWSYIRLISEMNLTNIVVIYASELPNELAVEALANFFMEIKTRKDRLVQKKLCKEYQLNFHEIATKVVDLKLKTFPSLDLRDTDMSSILHPPTNEELEFVGILEWLTLETETRDTLINRATVLLRMFFLNGSIKSAENLFERLASHLTEKSLEGFIESEDKQLASDVLEYLSFQACVAAFTKYEEATSNQKVAMETTNSLEYFANLRQRETQKEQVRDAAEALRSLLQSNWMSPETVHVSAKKDSRAHRILTVIRNLYIPEIAIRLHKLYALIGSVNNCLDLSTMIADDDLMLYECFQESGRLEEYLEFIREAALETYKQLRPKNRANDSAAPQQAMATAIE